MTRLITERLKSHSNSTQSEKNSNISNTSKNVASRTQSKENSHKAKKSSNTNSQFSEKIILNAEKASTSSTSTWAEVISKNTTKNANQKIKAQTAKLNETIQWKSRRMIMFSRNFVDEINSIDCRDRMNKRLKNEKIDILITMINLSKTKNSIVFTVAKKNTTNQLIKCRSVWENEFSVKSIQEDEVWFEQIIHEVEIETFDKTMNRFQKEIETYNDIKFARESIWLTREEKRENKTHSFVKISLKFKNDAEKALKKRLIVIEKSLQVSEFLNNRINQCHKCQKFEHLINACKEAAKCRYCAKNHDTRMHLCLICKSIESCSHISSKCSNCDEAHASNSSNCEHFRAIEIKSRKNNQLIVSWVIQLLDKLDSCNTIVQDLRTRWYRV
jgi:hypothetical protein